MDAVGKPQGKISGRSMVGSETPDVVSYKIERGYFAVSARASMPASGSKIGGADVRGIGTQGCSQAFQHSLQVVGVFGLFGDANRADNFSFGNLRGRSGR